MRYTTTEPLARATSDVRTLEDATNLRISSVDVSTEVRPTQGRLTDGGEDRPEPITGTDGDDILEGTDDTDVIHGLEGNDLINAHGGDDFVRAGQGNDTVSGGNGADKISGGTGDDLIFGDLGNDTLFGARGDDVLTGGEGADHFIFRVGHQGGRPVRGSGDDIITDFSLEEGDTIRIVGSQRMETNFRYGDSDGDGLDDYTVISFELLRNLTEGENTEDASTDQGDIELATITLEGVIVTAEDLGM